VKGVVGNSSANTAGTAEQSLLFKTAQQYTITFCEDSNFNGTCDSGEPAATGTKTVGAKQTGSEKDTLVFKNDFSASTNTCTPTLTQESAPSNTGVDVVQCLRDEFGNAVSGASVVWIIDTGPGSFTATQSTTDASGNATATLGNGVAGQQTSFHAEATDANGHTIISNKLVVNWTRPTTGRRHSATHLTLGKSSRTRLFGTLSANNTAVCRTGGRLISLYRDGRLLNQTTTASGGSYHFRLHKARRRHSFETKFAGNARCGASHSNTVASRAR